jgi:SWI/SNF-related matrix-associated actin-dependent regulator of chromatin subfamily A member 5
MDTSEDDRSFRVPVDDPEDSLAENNDSFDYTDSETNANTTASSVAGDIPVDGRRRRTQETQLRKSVFGKKHSNLDREKVRLLLIIDFKFHSNLY